MPVMFSKIVPILRMFSIDRTIEFYQGYLGCTVDWQHRFDEKAPLYMQVSRAGFAVHLSEHHGDGSPGANLRIETTGLAELHAELASRNYAYLRPGIETAPWGERGMTLLDPAGNRLQFVEREDRPHG